MGVIGPTEGPGVRGLYSFMSFYQKGSGVDVKGFGHEERQTRLTVVVVVDPCTVFTS